ETAVCRRWLAPSQSGGGVILSTIQRAKANNYSEVLGKSSCRQSLTPAALPFWSQRPLRLRPCEFPPTVLPGQVAKYLAWQPGAIALSSTATPPGRDLFLFSSQARGCMQAPPGPLTHRSG